MRVSVLNRQGAVRVDSAPLREAALAALRSERAGEGGEVTVVLVDDREITALNRRYLDRDRPTDVLAFPERRRPVRGEVVVSAQQAAAQAGDYGHTVSREVCLLIIHGVLHLLGYDDEDPTARRRMHRKQEQILAALNSPGAYPAPASTNSPGAYPAPASTGSDGRTERTPSLKRHSAARPAAQDR